MNKEKVIVICGPTASGKTALGVELAKKVNGEVISADSMQIYKEMNIGSAKPTIEEMQGIKHYLIDFVEPDKRYSVADYKRDAEKVIDEIIQKGKTPIVVGGTGLYINSLIYEIEYKENKIDEEYRKELEKTAEEKGLQYLYDIAEKIDSVAMKNISVNDKKRIIRVIEMFHETGKTKTQLEIESRQNELKYDYCVFAIDIERKLLYERINKRVDIMIELGLIDEVEKLVSKYPLMPTAIQGLGYKEVKDYLDKKMILEEMIEKIKMETRRYAKRQLTWFRKNKEIIWVDGLKEKNEIIKQILAEIKI